MLSFDLTFLWTAVNLVVLFLFLRKFLFGRVTRFMDERAARIEADIKKGAEDREEGERYRREHEALMRDAEARQARILQAARQKADRIQEEAVAAAQAEAGRIVARAEAEAAEEAEKARSRMRDEVASLALAAASKLMQANMSNTQNRRLVDRLLDDLEKDGGAA